VTTLDLSSRHGGFYFYDSNHVDMMARYYLDMDMMEHFFLDMDMMAYFSLDMDMMVDCCDNCLAIGRLQWLEPLGVGRMVQRELEL
jgi:hypothetical protein